MLSCSLMSNFFDCCGIEQQLNRTKKNSIMVVQNPWRLHHIRSCCCCCSQAGIFWLLLMIIKIPPQLLICNTEKKSNKCLPNSSIPLLPLLSLDNSSYNEYHQSPRTLMQYSSLELVSAQQLHTPLTTRT